MPPTRDSNGLLRFGGVDLGSVADRFGTPAYVYDIDAIAAEARSLHGGFDGAEHLIA